ncbi:MAG TPA: LPXTG cell wall anchor domain-containing protein [Candidatus Limnocylindria bacterium]
MTPIVQLPGGSIQAPPSNVQGVQTSPVAGVQSLPSTSTESAPTFPLAALGLGLMGMGGVLLRRRDTRI